MHSTAHDHTREKEKNITEKLHEVTKNRMKFGASGVVVWREEDRSLQWFI